MLPEMMMMMQCAFSTKLKEVQARNGKRPFSR